MTEQKNFGAIAMDWVYFACSKNMSWGKADWMSWFFTPDSYVEICMPNVMVLGSGALRV